MVETVTGEKINLKISSEVRFYVSKVCKIHIQKDKDMHHRWKMRHDILYMFMLQYQKREEKISQKLLKKVPHMVKVIEESFYRKASSLEEFTDKSTLKNRMKLWAMELVTKRKKQQELEQ